MLRPTGDQLWYKLWNQFNAQPLYTFDGFRHGLWNQLEVQLEVQLEDRLWQQIEEDL